MRRRSRQPLRNVLVPILLVVSVVLMLLPSRWVQPGRDIVLGVTGPVELGMNLVLDGIATLPERWRISSHMLRENTVLSTRVGELKSQVGFLEAQLIETQKLVAQLRDLKSVLPQTGYDLLPALIVNKVPVPVAGGGVSHCFVIGIGSREGVRRDDLVVTGYAVVGKVSAVGPLVSTVMLLTHPDFGIAARTPDGVEGVLQGSGDRNALLKYVGARPQIQPGDYVVTSGFDGKHPPKLLLGTVDTVAPERNWRGLRIEVTPAANFEQVSQVIVVRRLPLEP